MLTETRTAASRPFATCVPGAFDSHVHVIGPKARYPLWAGRSYQPPVATVAKLRAVLAQTGAHYALLVQPSVYGTDNRMLLDSLDGARLFGVVVPDPTTPACTMAEWARRGVRGIRLNLTNPNLLTGAQAVALCNRAQPHDWHLEVQINLDDVAAADVVKLLARHVAAPLVIDHLGFATSVDALRRLQPLLTSGRVWIKLSAPYRIACDWDTLGDMVSFLAGCRPDRLLWGSDWPHTNTAAAPRVLEYVGWLLDLLGKPVFETMASDNPHALLHVR